MTAAAALAAALAPRRPRSVVIPPRATSIGSLTVGAEFRLRSGEEGTVIRRPTARSTTVETICEPMGRVRTFAVDEEVLFLGTYSPHFGAVARRRDARAGETEVE